MNIIGPYASSQMLLHPFKKIIEVQTTNLTHEGITTGLFDTPSDVGLDLDHKEARDSDVEMGNGNEMGKNQTDDNGGRIGGEDDFWAWTTQAELGPATTWPLGEVLMARHDMQHSRIFNS